MYMNKETIIKGCENWVNNHKDEDLLLSYSSVVELLDVLKEQERIIKLYEKAEPFLHSHGWDWTQVEGWVKQE